MMSSKIFLECFLFVLVSRTICASIVLSPEENLTAKCLEKKCIPKCCENGKYLNHDLNFSLACIDSKRSSIDGQEYDFQNVPVYESFARNNLVLNQLNNATMADIFYLVPGKIYDVMADNMTFAENDPFVAEISELLISYLTVDGEVYLEFKNAYNRWTPVVDFCVDYAVTDEATGDAEVFNLLVLSPESEIQVGVTMRAVGSHYIFYLITSCIFLVLVLLVYILLPELRNLGGMILMAYVTSLLMGFFLLAIIHSGAFFSKCIELTATTYFFLLSTFCWMNVMSVDIWWTFRGYAKERPIHRRGENFKFCMYCLYGWGLPGIMTIGLVVVNETDLSHMPWIIKPMIPEAGCFLDGGQKLIYLCIPMTILILSNWPFFLMTVYKISRLMRGTTVLSSAAAGNSGSPAARQQQRNRLMVFLKLSVIMGISWLLEVVSFFAPKLRGLEVSDTYNMLIGFTIFLIFVCKKKIYKKLVARYYELRRTCFGGKLPTRTLTKSSQNIPLQVSNNPMPDDTRGKKDCAIFSFDRSNCKLDCNDSK